MQLRYSQLMNCAKEFKRIHEKGPKGSKSLATLNTFKRKHGLNKEEGLLVLNVSMMLSKGGVSTQLAHLFAWLSIGRSITALQALENFGCARLAARIHNLRSQGYGIADEFIETDTGKRVKQYWLDRKG